VQQIGADVKEACALCAQLQSSLYARLPPLVRLPFRVLCFAANPEKPFRFVFEPVVVSLQSTLVARESLGWAVERIIGRHVAPRHFGAR